MFSNQDRSNNQSLLQPNISNNNNNNSQNALKDISNASQLSKFINSNQQDGPILLPQFKQMRNTKRNNKFISLKAN